MNEIEQKFIELLQGNIEGIKQYYRGEVVVPPRSSLPCLMVFGTGTDIDAKSTACDIYVHNISIRIMLDVMDYTSDKGTENTIKSQEALRDIMFKLDENGIPSTCSLIGLLRANIGNSNWLFSNDMKVSYNTIRTGEFFYVSAQVDLRVVTDLIQRPPQNI